MTERSIDEVGAAGEIRIDEESLDAKWSTDEEKAADEIILDANWLSFLKDNVTCRIVKSDSKPSWTICRVPRALKNNNQEAYDPTFISLGPYHHRNLQQRNELKWQYLIHFLERNQDKQIEDYFQKKINLVKQMEDYLEDYLKQIKSLELQARAAYSDLKVDMSSNEFVQMMLFDGCFVVETIMRLAEGKNEEVETKAIADMLKLENQIPFSVLDKLYENVKKSEGGLPCLAYNAFSDILRIKMNSKSIPDKDQIHHILHLLHSCIIPNTSDDHHSGVRPGCLRCMLLMFKCCCCLPPVIFVILEAFFTLLVTVRGYYEGEEATEGQITNQLQTTWIPSATRLRESGITFKRKKQDRSFTDITFRDGVMEIPELVIDDRTIILFKNLIAFEQHFSGAAKHLTAYLSLMDCIINTADDITLLQQDKIIINSFGDNKDVADLFNKFCTNVFIHDDYRFKVYRDVNKHYNNKKNHWRQSLYDDHFKNPWKIVGILAGVIILAVTILQTVYTILGYNKY